MTMDKIELSIDDIVNAVKDGMEAKSTRAGSVIDEKVSLGIWDDSLTPIVSFGNVHSVFMTSQIEAPMEYNKLVALLDMMTEKDTVRIYINNGGGYVDSGLMIRSALNRCKGKTIAVLDGTVASIATIIALSCDVLEVGDHVSWLSHNYSGGVSGKGNEIKAQAEFMTKEFENTFRTIHKGFFTEEEISDLIDDKDYWLGKQDIERRWTAMKKVQ